MRESIFISHATPEDNDFAIWLAARLTSIGYKVWLDKNSLLGGEKTWEEIDQVIRNEANKVLLIYSLNICRENSPGKLKDGISKEISLTESVAKQQNIKDYLIILNIDNSPYDLFIGADRLNHISFANDWGTGLLNLLTKFEKDGIPKSYDGLNSFNSWFESNYRAKYGIYSKIEKYFLNIWKVPSLPDSFYIYKFSSEEQAQILLRDNGQYPISMRSNQLTTFVEPSVFLENQSSMKPRIDCININDAIEEKYTSSFLSTIEVRNSFIFLMSRVIQDILKTRRLSSCQLANKRWAYFYTPNILRKGKIRIRNDGQKKQYVTRSLFGKYKNLGFWHFAISTRVQLKPILAFLIGTHIIFTENQYIVWDNKSSVHRHRRSKGRTWFNKEWRDYLFAFMEGLKNSSGKVSISLSRKFVMTLPERTITIHSDFGYDEPQSCRALEELSEEATFYEMKEDENEQNDL